MKWNQGLLDGDMIELESRIHALALLVPSVRGTMLYRLSSLREGPSVLAKGSDALLATPPVSMLPASPPASFV